MTGDKSTELEGKAETNVGTAQRKVGEAKDSVRDAMGQESGRGKI